MVPRRKNRATFPANGCPLGTCMAVLGGAWTPHIIWNLSQGARRFTELKHDIPGVSAKVLAARLRKLVTIGVASRTALRTSPPTVEYALTDIGVELKPAIEAIVGVGNKLKERNAVRRLAPAART